MLCDRSIGNSRIASTRPGVALGKRPKSARGEISVRLRQLVESRTGAILGSSGEFESAAEAVRHLRRLRRWKCDFPELLLVIDGQARPVSRAELEALALSERLSLSSRVGGNGGDGTRTGKRRR